MKYNVSKSGCIAVARERRVSADLCGRGGERRKEQFRAAVCGEKSFIALFFNFIRSWVARVQTNAAAAVMGKLFGRADTLSGMFLSVRLIRIMTRAMKTKAFTYSLKLFVRHQRWRQIESKQCNTVFQGDFTSLSESWFLSIRATTKNVSSRKNTIGKNKLS
jgi:hypothetical protein